MTKITSDIPKYAIKSCIFLPLRTFFENKVQEDKERKELEKSLEESTVPVPLPLIPPPPPPPAKKKGQKQGLWLIIWQNL